MILEIKQQRQRVCFPGNYLLNTSTNDAQIVILTEVEKHRIQGGGTGLEMDPGKHLQPDLTAVEANPKVSTAHLCDGMKSPDLLCLKSCVCIRVTKSRRGRNVSVN